MLIKLYCCTFTGYTSDISMSSRWLLLSPVLSAAFICSSAWCKYDQHGQSTLRLATGQYSVKYDGLFRVALTVPHPDLTVWASAMMTDILLFSWRSKVSSQITSASCSSKLIFFLSKVMLFLLLISWWEGLRSSVCESAEKIIKTWSMFLKNIFIWHKICYLSLLLTLAINHLNLICQKYISFSHIESHLPKLSCLFKKALLFSFLPSPSSFSATALFSSFPKAATVTCKVFIYDERVSKMIFTQTF